MAIYKCGWEVEPGTTRINFNEWSERVLNPGSPDLKASALTTGPHCLLAKEAAKQLTSFRHSGVHFNVNVFIFTEVLVNIQTDILKSIDLLEIKSRPRAIAFRVSTELSIAS